GFARHFDPDQFDGAPARDVQARACLVAAATDALRFRPHGLGAACAPDAREENPMFGFSRRLRYAFAAGAMIAVTGHATPSRAESGTIVVDVTRAGFIVGVGGGEGVLVFRGQRYPFSVSGLSVGATIGASRAQLVGRAINLRQPSDLAGTYTA